MSCSLPHVRQLAVVPLDTGVSAPAPNHLRIPYTVVPAFHGGMLDDDTTAAVVSRWSRASRFLPTTGGHSPRK